jgi:hypothetical protein
MRKIVIASLVVFAVAGVVGVRQYTLASSPVGLYEASDS